MTIRLWSGVLSPFSAKVRVALAEKGIGYELLEVPWSRRTLWGPKPEEFLAVSPKGQVPVLLDGEVAVWDSTVIDEYLDERFPEPPLLPATPGERARCRLLEDAADEAMALHVTALVQEVFLKPEPADRDGERVQAATQGLERFYSALEAALAPAGGEGFLCGAFSVADIASYLVLGFASTLGAAPGDAHPGVVAWGERVRRRPSVAAEFEAMLKAAAAA